MAAPLEANRPLEPAGARRGYGVFLAGMGTWFTAWSLQTVLLQWLLVERLSESAERVGTAQMSLLLPSLAFLLVGGALADHVDRRRALAILHATAALGAVGLALALAGGALSYALVVGYALLAGTLQAFVMPTRDAQLSDVVSAGMSRAVAGLTMVQNGSQAIGALAAGLAAVVGAPAILALQAAILLSGSLASLLVPRLPKPAVPRPRLHLREVPPGLLEVLRSPVLRAVMLLNVSVGLVFVGSYLVLLPLLVRDLYGGGAEKLAALVGAFPAGSIFVNLGILARGGVLRQGRSLLLGQGFAGLCLGALAFGLPFWGAVLSVLGWGVGAAFAINAGRTLFQEHASEANRGRVLSVYWLAVLGTGPVGALVAGLLAGAIGTPQTLGTLSIAMTALIALTYAFTRVRHFR